MEEKSIRPLEGIIVLDFTQFASGPICTLTLAQLGANVIKVERPKTGEAGRFGTKNGEDMLFTTLHANKKSITADLKNPKGKELLFRLMEKADVVVENFSPGSFAKNGFTWEKMHEVNPRLIYASIKGYADNSPWSEFAAFDGTVQATGTVAAQTGELGGKPVVSGIALADDPSGHYCATGIIAALYQRTLTGKGQKVRINMQEVCISGTRMAFASQTENVVRGYGLPFVPPTAPNGVYKCKPEGEVDDGNNYLYLYVNMRAPGPKNEGWIGFCNVIGKPEWINDPGMVTGQQRADRVEEIDAALNDYLKEHTKTEAMRAFGSVGVPCGAVMTVQDVIHDQRMLDNGFLQVMHHQDFGDIIQVGCAYHLDDNDYHIEPSPKLGQNNDLYTTLFGLTEEEYAEYQACGAI